MRTAHHRPTSLPVHHHQLLLETLETKAVRSISVGLPSITPCGRGRPAPTSSKSLDATIRHPHVRRKKKRRRDRTDGARAMGGRSCGRGSGSRTGGSTGPTDEPAAPGRLGACRVRKNSSAWPKSSIVKRIRNPGHRGDHRRTGILPTKVQSPDHPAKEMPARSRPEPLAALHDRGFWPRNARFADTAVRRHAHRRGNGPASGKQGAGPEQDAMRPIQTGPPPATRCAGPRPGLVSPPCATGSDRR